MTTPQASAGSGFNLGNAYGTVTISTDGAKSALDSLANQLRNFGSGFTNVGQQISSFGSSLTAGMLPFTGAMGLGIHAAGSFQDAMNEIGARTGLAGEALDAIRQKALDLGAATSFSGQQAADAFLQLLSSGSSEAEALEQIEPVLRGAEAAGSDLAFTADTLTNVLAQFGLQATDSGMVIDDLIDVSGASSATLEDLSAGFTNAGTIAAGFGMSTRETAAALGVLRDAGIGGAEGGTQLKTILSELSKPGPRAELERLGIAFADSQGNIRPFNDILTDLNVAMSGMTEVQKRESIMELAGAFGQSGLSALLMAGGIDEMQTAMDEQAHFTEIAAARMAGFNGQLESLKGSIETLLINAFTPFIEMLTPYITMMVEIVNQINEWVKANQAIVQPLLQMIGALIILGPTLFGVGQAFKLVGFLITSLTSPIGLVLLAITAFTAAWSTNFLGIRDKLAPVIDGIRHLFSIFVNDIGQFGLAEAIAGIFGKGTISETMESSLEGALTIMGVSRDGAIKIVNSIWNVISMFSRGIELAFGVVRTAIGIFRSDILGVAQGISIFAALGFTGSESAEIVSRIYNVIETVQGIFWGFVGFVQNFLYPIVSALFGGVWQIISTIFTSLATAWTTQLQPAFERFGAAMSNLSGGGTGLKDTIVGLINTYFSFVSSLYSAVIPAIASVVVWFLDHLPGAIQFLIGIWNNFLMPAFNAIGGVITNHIMPALSTFWNWFTSSGFPAIKNAVVDFVTNAWNILKDGFVSFWNIVSPILTLLWDWFVVTAFPAIKTAVTDFIINYWDMLKLGFTTFWNLISPVLTSLWDWFTVTAFPAIKAAVTDFILNYWNMLKDGFTLFWGIVQPLIQPLVDWFTTGGFQEMATSIGNFLRDNWQPVVDAFSTVWDAISPGITALKNGLMAAFNWVKTNVIDPMTNALNGVFNIGNESAPPIPSGSGVTPQGGIFASGGTGASAQSTVVPSGTSIAPLPMAKGSNWIPQDMLALLHKGEAVIPRPFNMEMLDNRMSSSSMASDTGTHNEYHLNIENITANTPEEGRVAGESFAHSFMETLRST